MHCGFSVLAEYQKTVNIGTQLK